MNREELQKEALKNLLALSRNVYPGRGIICGLDETRKYFVQGCWIGGRSADSRNRVYVVGADCVVKTAIADPTLPSKNPELTLYTAMMECNGNYAVSNGAQTQDACMQDSLYEAMHSWSYEPDPNHTPRITALFGLENQKEDAYYFDMSILKKNKTSEKRDATLYQLSASEPGLGNCIHTYLGDGNPLPSFEGEPYLLPLLGDVKGVAEVIWENLNEDNRVAIAVKFIEIESGQSHIHIINKYKQVTG